MTNFLNVLFGLLIFFFSAQADPNIKVFDELIEPVLQAKCVHCHGEQKSKGKLRMDSKEQLLAGGSGAGEDILIKGDYDNSELIFRITLPKEDIEAMPPMEGDHDYNPVTSEELAVMKSWINLGADFDLLISELDESAKKAAEHVLKNMPENKFIVSTEIAKSLPLVPSANTKIIHALKKIGVVVMPIAQNTNALYVNASCLGESFNDEKLRHLEALSPQLLWLNLARTAVSDEGGVSLSKFSLLTRLHLENTFITDAISPYLQNLSNLEYLNLYGTSVSDSSITYLKDLRKLEKIFLWQTKFTDFGIEKLRKEFVDHRQYSKLKSQSVILSNKVQRITEEENKKVSSKEKILQQVSKESTDQRPVNKTCFMNGKVVNDSKVSIFEGRKVGFCCQKCKTKFDKEPSTYRSKIIDFEPSEKFKVAFAALQEAQAIMDRKIENIGVDLRITSAKLQSLGPEINNGWATP